VKSTKIREQSRVLPSSLTSEHGLDATRMWQAQQLHAALARVLTLMGL